MALRVERLGVTHATEVGIINVQAFTSSQARQCTVPDPRGLSDYMSKTAAKQMVDERNAFFIGAFEGDKLIAYGKWRLEDEVELNKPEEESTWFAGANVAAKVHIFGGIDAAHAALMQRRPHWSLVFLATAPQHERKGAGGRIVKWGTDQADTMGIETYLDATPAGRPVYERHGFEFKGENRFDLKPYGTDMMYTTFSMLRPARST